MNDLPPHHHAHNLNTAAHLTLVTIRLWTHIHLRCRVYPCAWDDGLKAAGLPATASSALDELLTVLAVASTALADALPLCAHRLSRTEYRILQSLNAAQVGDSAAVEKSLGIWLPPTALRVAVKRCDVFSRALAEAVSPIYIGDAQYAQPCAGVSPLSESRLH